MSNITLGPDLALVLVTAGMLCIYLEFLRPGMILAGVCGSVMLLFGLAGFIHSAGAHGSPFHWRGAALIFLGFTVLLPEARYQTKHLLTVIAAIFLPWGAILMEPRLHLITVVLTLVPFALITSFLLNLAVRARRNKIG